MGGPHHLSSQLAWDVLLTVYLNITKKFHLWLMTMHHSPLNAHKKIAVDVWEDFEYS